MSTPDTARRSTTAAFLMPVTYLIWFPIVFALGYWITATFDAYPSTEVPLVQTGLDGIIAAACYGLICGLPAWIGVWLAAKAGRGGGTAAAVLALVLNLLIAVAMFALAFT
ncbi:MAG: hypothetical protein IPG68_01950 [Micrococcales bacterium]|nr:hypothetical protein [Micrococcales bacterium]